MKFHRDYAKVQEAINDPPTWVCIVSVLQRMGTNEVIGADEAVLREAAELHPGADRELVRCCFTYKSPRSPAPEEPD